MIREQNSCYTTAPIAMGHQLVAPHREEAICTHYIVSLPRKSAFFKQADAPIDATPDGWWHNKGI